MFLGAQPECWYVVPWKRKFLLSRKGADHTVTLPKLYVMAVDEVLRVFLGNLVVGADKFDGAEKLTIGSDNVRPVFSHG